MTSGGNRHQYNSNPVPIIRTSAVDKIGFKAVHLLRPNRVARGIEKFPGRAITGSLKRPQLLQGLRRNMILLQLAEYRRINIESSSELGTKHHGQDTNSA